MCLHTCQHLQPPPKPQPQSFVSDGSPHCAELAALVRGPVCLLLWHCVQLCIALLLSTPHMPPGGPDRHLKGILLPRSPRGRPATPSHTHAPVHPSCCSVPHSCFLCLHSFAVHLSCHTPHWRSRQALYRRTFQGRPQGPTPSHHTPVPQNRTPHLAVQTSTSGSRSRWRQCPIHPQTAARRPALPRCPPPAACQQPCRRHPGHHPAPGGHLRGRNREVKQKQSIVKQW
jgi:hypothetical protein